MHINQLVPFAIVAGAVLVCSGQSASAQLIMQRTSRGQHAAVANFCLGRKDQDYCSDRRTMTRCRDGTAISRSMCASGCDVGMTGVVTCSNPGSAPSE